jgi:hypothetical protein
MTYIMWNGLWGEKEVRGGLLKDSLDGSCNLSIASCIVWVFFYFIWIGRGCEGVYSD